MRFCLTWEQKKTRSIFSTSFFSPRKRKINCRFEAIYMEKILLMISYIIISLFSWRKCCLSNAQCSCQSTEIDNMEILALIESDRHLMTWVIIDLLNYFKAITTVWNGQQSWYMVLHNLSKTNLINHICVCNFLVKQNKKKSIHFKADYW